MFLRFSRCINLISRSCVLQILASDELLANAAVVKLLLGLLPSSRGVRRDFAVKICVTYLICFIRTNSYTKMSQYIGFYIILEMFRCGSTPSSGKPL
jgi:hypothetical protein